MHRSASTSRASEEYFLNMSPQVKGSPGLKAVDDHLPIYDPLSEISKKESSRLKTAENAVHFIPVVLILCAVVLWFFSNPAVTVGNKADSLAARVEGLAVDGSTNLTQIGLLPATEAEELKPIERTVNGGARESPGKSM